MKYRAIRRRVRRRLWGKKQTDYFKKIMDI